MEDKERYVLMKEADYNNLIYRLNRHDNDLESLAAIIRKMPGFEKAKTRTLGSGEKIRGV